jgi:hypothetical protein
MTALRPDQIARFLKAFELFARFDAEQRLVRGYGAAFDPDEWPTKPDPDVVAVRSWLEGLTGIEPAVEPADYCPTGS